jgi:monoamine oxidase
MFSLRNFFADGQVCELGGELIDTPHERIRAVAAELNIPLDDLATDDPALRQETFFFEGSLRSEKEVSEAFLPVAQRILTDLRPLGDDPDPTYRQPRGAEALDRLTIAEWLDRAGVSGWFRRLLDVAYTTEYGLETDQQSALNLLLMIGTDSQHFQIFGESDERFHVKDGNDRIVQELARRVQDAIETEHVLEALTRRSDGRYELTFQRGGGTVTATGSHVLLAMPFTMLRQVRLAVPLPAAKRRAIDELRYGTNAKLMLGFSSRPWRTQSRANGSVLTDLPFQLTWETSRLQPGGAGILTNFSGGRHGVAVGQGTEAEQAAALVAALEQVFPGVQAAHAGQKAVRFHWPSHRWTQGSYASYGPGQWTGIRGAEQEPVDGLFFAGEHCSAGAQGFMEGGCETGHTAATAIAASLALRTGMDRRAWLRRAVG